MSKSDILQALPKLALEDRQEILERICELEESDLLKGCATPARVQPRTVGFTFCLIYIA